MNLRYQFYRAYYDKFDPRVFTPDNETDRQEVDAAKRANKTIAQRNTEWFQRKNADLYGFTPAKDGGRINPTWYHPGADALETARGLGTLELETTYPGLLIGTGYKHETNTEDEITIGFYFDYTTGLPVIPGSSVKGIIRSAFPRTALLGKNAKPDIQATRYAQIRACLKFLGVEPPEGREWIDRIEASIFDRPATLAAGDAGGRSFSQSADVFFDAVIADTDATGKILGSDFITPHGDNPLRNPIPLRMIKVLPEVNLRFSFRTVDAGWEDGYQLPAEKKEELFRLILLMFGVGAKTNVGYGHLIDPTDRTAELPFLELEVEQGAAPTGSPPPSGGILLPKTESALPVFELTDDKWFVAKSLNPKRPPEVNAKVLKKLSDRSVQVQLLISGREDKSAVLCTLKIFTGALPAPGQWVSVQIKSFSGKKAKVKGFLLKDNYYKLIGKC